MLARIMKSATHAMWNFIHFQYTYVVVNPTVNRSDLILQKLANYHSIHDVTFA